MFPKELQGLRLISLKKPWWRRWLSLSLARHSRKLSRRSRDPRHKFLGMGLGRGAFVKSAASQRLTLAVAMGVQRGQSASVQLV